MRLLISGSRNFDTTEDYYMMATFLLAMRDFYPDLVVVHGDCPKGADRLARIICEKVGIPQERYPANWIKYRKAAGPIRNQEMVDTRPDYAWFFPKGRSVGTKDCWERVVKAGIPYHVYGKFE